MTVHEWEPKQSPECFPVEDRKLSQGGQVGKNFQKNFQKNLQEKRKHHCKELIAQEERSKDLHRILLIFNLSPDGHMQE